MGLPRGGTPRVLRIFVRVFVLFPPKIPMVKDLRDFRLQMMAMTRDLGDLQLLGTANRGALSTTKSVNIAHLGIYDGKGRDVALPRLTLRAPENDSAHDSTP